MRFDVFPRLLLAVRAQQMTQVEKKRLPTATVKRGHQRLLIFRQYRE
jgi:hypothetical protein